MIDVDKNRNKVEEILLNKSKEKGFLSEDDIVNTCIDFDLDIIEIDRLCEKLLNQKTIITEDFSNTSKDKDELVDRSQLDYEGILNSISEEYPKCKDIIDVIRNIIPPQPREWQTLIGEAQSGNVYARKRIVEMYLRTVMKHAYNYSKDNYCEFEDAFQNGVLGLIDAIDKYDNTSPDAFPSYFPLWVRQHMQRYGEIKGTVLRYPVHYKDKLMNVVNRACEVLENDKFEEAVELIKDEYAILTDEIHIEHLYPYIDLLEKKEYADVEFENINSEENYNTINNKFDDVNLVEEDMCLEIISSKEMKRSINKALEKLKDREKGIIEMRYGLIDGNEHTLEEVGNMLGVTRERIRQIESKALKKIAKLDKGLKDFLK